MARRSPSFLARQTTCLPISTVLHLHRVTRDCAAPQRHTCPCPALANPKRTLLTLLQCRHVKPSATWWLRVGDHVELRGLSKAALNGQHGQLSAWVEQRRRWVVRLRATSREVSIAPGSLRLVRRPAVSPAPASHATPTTPWPPPPQQNTQQSASEREIPVAAQVIGGQHENVPMARVLSEMERTVRQQTPPVAQPAAASAAPATPQPRPPKPPASGAGIGSSGTNATAPATWHGFNRGDQAVHLTSDGRRAACVIVGVHSDDAGGYFYTIRLGQGGQGREKQTVLERLERP